eukprot:5272265-Alexandrium_andersonii.AAC.1
MECTVAQEGKDFEQIVKYIRAELPNYNVNTWTNVDPTQVGYPIRRARVIISGARGDLVHGPCFEELVRKVVVTPMPVACTYIGFLGLGDPLPWERLHQMPTAEELRAIKESGCACSFDPWVPCPVHPCKCRMCATSPGEMLCEWRKKAS